MTNEEINAIMEEAANGFSKVRITKTNGRTIEGTVEVFCYRTETNDGKSGVCLLTAHKGGYYIPEDYIREIEIIE